MHRQDAANKAGHPFMDDYNKMVADIQNATDGPPLLPLEEAIELSKQADDKSVQ